MKWLIWLVMLCWSNSAIAYDGGICMSRDIFYRNVDFRLEQSTDLTYTLQFAKEHHGQIVKEAGEELYSIIYNDQVVAPQSQYTCEHMESGD